MLIDQLANVVRMVGQADQKPGRDAFLRYEVLHQVVVTLAGVAPGLLIRLA